jgi:hypothetical protein
LEIENTGGVAILNVTRWLVNGLADYSISSAQLRAVAARPQFNVDCHVRRRRTPD